MVVKHIFRMACMGMTTAQIAKILNAENIPTPYKFKNKQGIYYPWRIVSDDSLWHLSMVVKILRDERYLGKVIYGKRYRPEVGSGKTLKSGKANWIVAEEMHEPLVSTKDFKTAQKVMTEFMEIDTQRGGNHLLSGKIKCGICGYSLARKKDPTPRYLCETRLKAKECGCMRGHVKEHDLAEIILSAIRAYIPVLLNEEAMAKPVKQENSPRNLRKQITEYLSFIEKVKEQKAMLYDDYADDMIDRNIFEKERDRLMEQQANMESLIEKLQSELTKMETAMNPDRPQEDKLKQYLKADTLTREMVTAFVDNVCIYTDRSMKINWRFS